MFSRKCFCKGNIPKKIVRPLLAALSVNGLSKQLELVSAYLCFWATEPGVFIVLLLSRILMSASDTVWDSLWESVGGSANTKPLRSWLDNHDRCTLDRLETKK